MFDRLERMTDAELIYMRNIWEQGDTRERELAWQRVKAIVRTRHLEDVLDAGRNRIGGWVNNNPVYGIVGAATLPSNPSGLDAASVRQQALPPMLDAVAAAVAADDLTAEEEALLTEPLRAIARRAS